MKKVFITVVAVLLMVSALPTFVGAEELQPGKCEMTIISNKHNWDNMAQASGPCEGRVEGYYLAETNTFQLVGAVTTIVNQNGQQFTIGTPKVPYGQSILTVFIQKVEETKPTQPKEEPKPDPKPTQPKEEPKPDPKPTQPKEESKPAPKPPQPKEEPKQETKPKQETSTNTKPKQETSTNTNSKPGTSTATIKPKQEASNQTKTESKQSSVTQENKTETAQKVEKSSETNEEKEGKSKTSSTEEQEDESKESVEEEEVEEEPTEVEEENDLASNDIEEAVSTFKESESDSKSSILPGVIISIILLIGASIGGFIWYRRRERD